MKGGQYAHLIISYWYYSVRFVAAGSNHSLYSWRVSPYSTYYCSYSHNNLADKGGILSLLDIALKIDFLPFALSLSKGEGKKSSLWEIIFSFFVVSIANAHDRFQLLRKSLRLKPATLFSK
jgi:hypothetical protein